MNDMPPCFIDSHLHLQDDRFSGNTELLIDMAMRAGVCMLLCNGVQESDWPAVVNLGRNHDAVLPFLGIHPWHADIAAAGWDMRLSNILESLAQLAGVGESGLDKSCPTDFAVQVELFEKHLQVAHRMSLPIALHCVRSWGKLVDILESYSRNDRLPTTMIHSFNGSYETMRRLTDIGCFISYSIKITEPQSEKVRQVFIRTPVDQLLLETDAPGQLNNLPFSTGETITSFSEPILIPAFYQWAAQQRKTEPSNFKTQIYRNAQIYTNKTFSR